MRLATILILASLHQPSHAADGPRDPYEKQVVSDCARDALRYCAKQIPQGREMILACMIENKDRLRPRCARYLYGN